VLEPFAIELLVDPSLTPKLFLPWLKEEQLEITLASPMELVMPFYD
jgi:hypothetical protein